MRPPHPRRDQARRLLAAAVPPEAVEWRVPGEAPGLFTADAALPVFVLVPRALLDPQNLEFIIAYLAVGGSIPFGRNMPAAVGDIGFPMVVHPRDADTAWVFPMNGTTVWPRTSPDGKPAAYVTRNAGRTWQRQDQGLPAGTHAEFVPDAKPRRRPA